MTKISVIIPMLNEVSNIRRLLSHLARIDNTEIPKEIIVVDGGSVDGSLEAARNFNNILLLQSACGRAKQMNKGAEYAKGEVLYFLHADSFPPTGYDKLILNEFNKQKRAGCFRLKFDHDHWWLKLAGWFTRFNWTICRGGDQSLFISKDLFDELGGFDESFLIMEDNDLIQKLYAKKEFVVIQKPIKTSARCYSKNGVWKLQFHFWAIYLKKRLGAGPEELHDYYQRHIA